MFVYILGKYIWQVPSHAHHHSSLPTTELHLQRHTLYTQHNDRGAQRRYDQCYFVFSFIALIILYYNWNSIQTHNENLPEGKTVLRNYGIIYKGNYFNKISFSTGLEIVSKIYEGREEWGALFEPSNFFQKYKYVTRKEQNSSMRISRWITYNKLWNLSKSLWNTVKLHR